MLVICAEGKITEGTALYMPLVMLHCIMEGLHCTSLGLWGKESTVIGITANRTPTDLTAAKKVEVLLNEICK